VVTGDVTQGAELYIKKPINVALNDNNAPNDLNAPNELNVLNDNNAPNDLNEPNAHNALNAPNELNVLNVLNDNNAPNERNQMDQTDLSCPPRSSSRFTRLRRVVLGCNDFFVYISLVWQG